jgi:hypothetical protein
MAGVEVSGSGREAAGTLAARGASGQRARGRAWSRAAWRRYRRPLAAAACLGAVGLLYVAYLGQSRSLGTDADGASNVLQAWDMLHGNPLLRGWWLSDVSFYTTELPEYMLTELARGLNPGVINAAGAATYTVLVVLAAVLAKGRATGRAGVLRALTAAGIMLAPGPGFGAASLLSSPDHTGTQIPLLLTWLAIDRLGGDGEESPPPPAQYLPWLVGALLTWTEVADQMAIYVGSVPVIVVSAMRIWGRRGSWRRDAGLLAAGAGSVVLAMAVTRLIRLAGGFSVAPVSTGLAPLAQLPHHAWLTLESVLTLFGADFSRAGPGPGPAFAVAHLAGLALVIVACGIAGRRLLTEPGRLVPLLFAGIAVNLGAYLFSTLAFGLGSAHELAAVLPFGAALAGRLIPGRLFPGQLFSGRLAGNVLAVAAVATLAVYAGALGYAATGPPRPPTTQAVASWLTANHLTSGIGDYWTANITTVATSGRVEVRPVSVSCGRFAPYAWESRQSWYQTPSTATFLLLAITSVAGANGTSADAIAQFGAAQRTARIGDYEIMVWNHDLLPALTSGPAAGCGPARSR